MDKMFQVADRMDQEVFQHHLKRCIDSGLWIPNAKEQEEREKQQQRAKEAKEAEAEGKEGKKSQEGKK
jgi:cell division cycle protein 37